MPGQNIDFSPETQEARENALVATCLIGVNHDASVKWIDLDDFIQPEMPVNQLITVERPPDTPSAIGALLAAIRFERHDLIVVNGLKFQDREASFWPGCLETLRRHRHPRIIILSDYLSSQQDADSA